MRFYPFIPCLLYPDKEGKYNELIDYKESTNMGNTLRVTLPSAPQLPSMISS